MELFYAKAKDGELIFDNKKEAQDYLRSVDGKSLIVRIHRDTGIRTSDQNKALHKYFDLLATGLNEAGLTVQMVLQKKVELDWTPNLIKEMLWRDIQIRLFGKTSTKELDKVSDINLVHETLTRHLGEKFGFENPEFPHDPEKIK
jgi:hypothetical protein